MNQSDLSLSDLYQLENDISQQHWGIDYTGTIELVNRAWRCRAACFAHDPSDKSIQIIRMSRKKNAAMTAEQIKGWLLHELVHWHLYNIGVPFHDTDREFIDECLRVGANISKNRKAQDAFKRHQAGDKYISLDEYYRSVEKATSI